MGRPGKIKYPVGLEVALRKVLGKKRPEDRMKIFREWRRTVLRARLKREPTDEEVEAEIKICRRPNFDAANCPLGFWDALSDFVPVFHKENRTRKAQAAAIKMWSKKSKKNL